MTASLTALTGCIILDYMYNQLQMSAASCEPESGQWTFGFQSMVMFDYASHL